MQRRHAEHASPLTIRSFRGLEHPNLDDHGEGFRDEDASHHQQGPEAVGQQSHTAEGGSHRQGSRVAHEGPSWVSVVHQKPKPCPGHGHAEASQGGISVVSPEHQLKCQTGKHQCSAAAGQAIQAIGEVGGVALRQNDKQPQRPDQKP